MSKPFELGVASFDPTADAVLLWTSVGDHEGEVAWEVTADEALTAAGVEPWMELPLWLPEADGPGTWQVAASRAEATGLRARPIAETVADIWAWLESGGAEAEGEDWLSPNAATGLAAEREREVLAATAR